ncbi:MAG: hypothetical protein PHU14_16250 [Methylovulum sp.]|nr:hypothetical protein [Methylovulum sp.]
MFLFRLAPAGLGGKRHNAPSATVLPDRLFIHFNYQGEPTMYQNPKQAGNTLLLRGATLWLLMALVLAWCMVFMKLKMPVVGLIFEDFNRLLQGHLDFLLMSALLFGFYATKVPLPWTVRWAMVVGAFTNSSLFVLQAIFPALNPPTEGALAIAFRLFSMLSIIITSYGFGRGAVMVFRSTLVAQEGDEA